ncbi:hypothetical protein GCWU000341_00780 [Oribacterium sp. oral taxon 078 str. F0262]|nr:hypothetical protein GCWU000341_00780 [Oribacterium sp. oral taxon 078 str. F0262]
MREYVSFRGYVGIPQSARQIAKQGGTAKNLFVPGRKNLFLPGTFCCISHGSAEDYFSKETASLAEIGGSPVGEERREAVPGPGRKRAFARIDRAAGRHRGKRRIQHGEKGKIWILRGAVHPGDFDECGE